MDSDQPMATISDPSIGTWQILSVTTFCSNISVKCIELLQSHSEEKILRLFFCVYKTETLLEENEKKKLACGEREGEKKAKKKKL